MEKLITIEKNIKLNPEQYSAAKRVVFPIRYHDWNIVTAFFPIPAKNAQKILPSSRLKPLLIFPGVALVSLSAMEYKIVENMPSYNEFMVSIPVQYDPATNFPGLPLFVNPVTNCRKLRKFGVYVHRLPVTTQIANYLGWEHWGYHKFLADIEFVDSEKAKQCRLSYRGEDIITLKLSKKRLRDLNVDLFTYTSFNGKLARSLFETGGGYNISMLPGSATIKLGKGLLAAELKELNIGKVSLGQIYTEKLTGVLHLPHESLDI